MALQLVNRKDELQALNSLFSKKDAAEYVSNTETGVVLIDGEKLAELVIDNDIGVSRFATYEIRKTDTDYFSEE
jgi:restriction system protein